MAALVQGPENHHCLHFLLGSRTHCGTGECKSLKHSDTAHRRTPRSTSEGPTRQEQGRRQPLARPHSGLRLCQPVQQETGLQISGSGRSSGEGNGNPLQYPCVENPIDGGVWRATYSPRSRKELDTTKVTGHTHVPAWSELCSGWELLLLLLSHFSRVRLFSTPWTAAHQAPPSMGFSRQ